MRCIIAGTDLHQKLGKTYDRSCTHQADDDDDESDCDTSSVDSTEEIEFHNTSEGPVMIRRSPRWHGAPALTHLLQTHSGADLMAGLDALAAKKHSSLMSCSFRLVQEFSVIGVTSVAYVSCFTS